MDILEKFFHNQRKSELHEELRKRFDLFRELLVYNNKVLHIIGDLEEKGQGDFLFDLVYIHQNLEELVFSIKKTIEIMIAVGGDKYNKLYSNFQEIENQILSFLPGGKRKEPDLYVRIIEDSKLTHNLSIGNKNAQLGEMHSLGLPVPRGFAITAWAYNQVISRNKLQNRISRLLESLDIRNHDDLLQASKKIRTMIRSSHIPNDIINAVMKEYDRFENISSSGEYIAMRSSAIGEDSLFTFAGQYSSFLNVAKDEILKKYLDILASKFTANAIYYFLSHSMEEAELAMSVGCMEMVDAQASGVVYSRDPLDISNDLISIHSVFGLGPYLVEGIITPDVFYVNRNSLKVVKKTINRKDKELILGQEKGTINNEVENSRQKTPSISEEVAVELAKMAIELEDHYHQPQDIEWALDRNSGKIVLLQSRLLHAVPIKNASKEIDSSKYKVLISNGLTVCPGSGGGPITRIDSTSDIQKVQKGDVVITHFPSPRLIEVLEKASAIVTELGSGASHFAALARENRVPTLVGVGEILSKLEDGHLVTVDAGLGKVFDGYHKNYIKATKPDYALFDDTPIFKILRKIMNYIAPLNLVNPTDPEFRISNCKTIHDITRFTHQRGIEEIFNHAKLLGSLGAADGLLKSSIPIPVKILNLDRKPSYWKTSVSEKTIPSDHLQNFWNGILEEGWPELHPDPQRFTAVSASTGGNQRAAQFTENSFAVIFDEYMLISLRLGFHFTSVEAFIGDDPENNYIRVHYKGGGAAPDRRQRRISLLETLLSRMGFVNSVRSDFINSSLENVDKKRSSKILYQLGRLTMLTKQLDMALSNDRVASWYTEDYARRIGLEYKKAFPS